MDYSAINAASDQDLSDMGIVLRRGDIIALRSFVKSKSQKKTEIQKRDLLAAFLKGKPDKKTEKPQSSTRKIKLGMCYML